MESSKTLEILKQAILLETRGRAFYSAVAEKALDADVKQIFEIMAEEENQHIKFLSEQYKKYKVENKFDLSLIPDNYDEESIVEQILTKKIKENISGVSFEAAAIASAIDLENRAIAVYSKRAEEAEDEDERKFYGWLAQWESGHHKILHELDMELRDKVWSDNSFWPF